jgi:uncharacterized protein YndB with AHSA1/START domain
MSATAIDPQLDLVLERTVDVAPDLVWRAWTEPDLLKQWFAPKPWSISAVEVDLQPGGAFSTTMRSPEGEEFPNVGCFLVVQPRSVLIFTSALGPGFRPQLQPDGGFPFTAVVTIEPAGAGTRYTAIAKHPSPETRKTHEEMGFVEGWGATLEQLVELAKTL